jgi:hypothetical protein
LGAGFLVGNIVAGFLLGLGVGLIIGALAAAYLQKEEK